MNIGEIVEKCKDDKHCYHRDGVLLMSAPPQYRLHCCHCGHMKYVQESVPKPSGLHGKFYRE